MSDFSVRDSYTARANDSDPVVRRVAQLQLARLDGACRTGGMRGTATTVRSPSRWAHVPLADLFAAAGNPLHQRARGIAESGHEPVHGSRSGRCVLIDPAAGRWYCRGCRSGGDAAALVMAQRGWSYRQAARWLANAYGAPAPAAGRPMATRRRRVLEA